MFFVEKEKFMIDPYQTTDRLQIQAYAHESDWRLSLNTLPKPIFLLLITMKIFALLTKHDNWFADWRWKSCNLLENCFPLFPDYYDKQNFSILYLHELAQKKLIEIYQFGMMLLISAAPYELTLYEKKGQRILLPRKFEKKLHKKKKFYPQEEYHLRYV